MDDYRFESGFRIAGPFEGLEKNPSAGLIHNLLFIMLMILCQISCHNGSSTVTQGSVLSCFVFLFSKTPSKSKSL
jgi:hypothetical protein